jgi:hypothetical protein
LDAFVAQKVLDLLDLTTCVMAQSGAGAPQIMRSNTGQPALAAGALHNRPDHSWTEPVLRNSARLVDRAEHRSHMHGRSGHPRLNGGPNPIRNRNGSDVAAFPDQISKNPMVLAPLEVGDRYSSNFGPAKPTA